MPENFFTTTARKVTALEKGRREAIAENGYSMGDVIGSYLALPQLRGFWPFSSVNESANAIDLSGQGRTLTNVGGWSYGVGNSIVPYVFLDGATQYYTRATEAGLNFNANPGWTWGWWEYTASTAAGNHFGKVGAAGNFGYSINHASAAAPRAYISSDGAATTSVVGAGPVSAWRFVVGRFTPSTELAIFVNNIKTVNTTAIPASIFASTAAFQVGASSAAGQYFTGRCTLPFLCSEAISDALLSRLYNICRTMFGV